MFWHVIPLTHLDFFLGHSLISFEGVFNTGLYLSGSWQYSQLMSPSFVMMGSWPVKDWNKHVRFWSLSHRHGWKFNNSRSWTFKIPILKLQECPLTTHNFKFKWSIVDRLTINQRTYYNLPNSGFWGWLSVKSQPQNPEFRNNPENFHPCIGKQGRFRRGCTKVQSQRCSLTRGFKKFAACIANYRPGRKTQP